MKSHRNEKIQNRLRMEGSVVVMGDHSEGKQPWSKKPPPGHRTEKRCRNGSLIRKRKKAKRITKKRN